MRWGTDLCIISKCISLEWLQRHADVDILVAWLAPPDQLLIVIALAGQSSVSAPAERFCHAALYLRQKLLSPSPLQEVEDAEKAREEHDSSRTFGCIS